MANTFKTLCVMAAILMSGCGATAQSNKQEQKILVVYYSWGGNTKAIAEHIQSLTGADIFEIKPVNPYPEEYRKCTEQAKTEITEGYKPEIVGKVENIEQYGIIFVGSPNWWSTIAPPVSTFLTDYDLTGKTVVPFLTHGGGGQARLFEDIAKLCPKSYMKDGFVAIGSSAKTAESEVKKWLQELGF